MDVKVIIAMHKPYDVPVDEMYVPVHVGAYGKMSFTNPNHSRECVSDNRGDNISEKNALYCENTGLYFAWKNLAYNALGLVHYRRHFTVCSKSFINSHHWTQCVLTKEQAEALLEKYDIIVPKKRRYFIESLYSHYAHTHDVSHLVITGQIVDRLAPYISPYLERAYASTSGYMFNMFIMRRSLVDEYCNFLFPVLAELEKRVDMTGMSAFDARYIGRISELLFNAWLLYKKEQGCKVKAIGCLHTEPEPWGDKIKKFLSAKFLGKKYSQSF